MSLSLASQVLFVNSDTRLTIVRVQSLKCHYRVAIEEECATVYGPGVEQEIDTKLHNITNYPPEAQAIMAVLLFEEGE